MPFNVNPKTARVAADRMLSGESMTQSEALRSKVGESARLSMIFRNN
jgi:hypothetical protein